MEAGEEVDSATERALGPGVHGLGGELELVGRLDLILRSIEECVNWEC
jgi:hypothetical protein